MDYFGMNEEVTMMAGIYLEHWDILL